MRHTSCQLLQLTNLRLYVFMFGMVRNPPEDGFILDDRDYWSRFVACERLDTGENLVGELEQTRG